MSGIIIPDMRMSGIIIPDMRDIRESPARVGPPLENSKPKQPFLLRSASKPIEFYTARVGPPPPGFETEAANDGQ